MRHSHRAEMNIKKLSHGYSAHYMITGSIIIEIATWTFIFIGQMLWHKNIIFFNFPDNLSIFNHWFEKKNWKIWTKLCNSIWNYELSFTMMGRHLLLRPHPIAMPNTETEKIKLFNISSTVRVGSYFLAWRITVKTLSKIKFTVFEIDELSFPIVGTCLHLRLGLACQVRNQKMKYSNIFVNSKIDA